MRRIVQPASQAVLQLASSPLVEEKTLLCERQELASLQREATSMAHIQW
jgi:hypothetical protein